MPGPHSPARPGVTVGRLSRRVTVTVTVRRATGTVTRWQVVGDGAPPTSGAGPGGSPSPLPAAVTVTVTQAGR